MRVSIGLIICALSLTLAACGGGGGGASSVTPSGGNGGVTATPTPSPTATPSSATVSGTVTDFNSSVPLAGAVVTLGTAPTSTSCNGAQTATLNVCGTIAAPAATATTSATGTFSLVVPAGTYMVTVAPATANSYATLHRTATIAAGPNAVGTIKLTALSTTLQTWLADVNNQRATVSVPTSFANMTVDEYAQEQAQKWADSVAAGTTVYGDAGYAPFQVAYSANPGAMYSASGVLAVALPPAPQIGFAGSTPQSVDTAWMGEKANCPSGNWQTCTFTGQTGHYINLSNTRDVWVGLGLAATQNTTLNGFPINVMIIQN